MYFLKLIGVSQLGQSVSTLSMSLPRVVCACVRDTFLYSSQRRKQAQVLGITPHVSEESSPSCVLIMGITVTSKLISFSSVHPCVPG